jgi:hypothetical protein
MDNDSLKLLQDVFWPVPVIVLESETDTEICAVCGLMFAQHDGREEHRFSKVRS